MARAPFDGPWQGRAEGRGRCARGSRAQSTDWDGEADCRWLQAEKPGGSEQKRCEPGDGRDRAGRHGPNLERLGRGGKIRSELEDGRDGHMLSRAIKFAVTTTTHSPLYCTSLSFSLGQGQSRNAGLAASELGDEALLPYFHPHSTSLSFSLGQGQNEQPPV